jgi:hypothetical protein
MKKLLAMTLVASVAGVVSAELDCGPGEVPVVCQPMVYNVKFNGKTTVGRPLTTRDIVTDCGPTEQGGTVIYRVPGSLAIDGWIAYCDCDCTAVLEIGSADDAAFWASRPARGVVDMDNEVTFINVIGLNKGQAEILSDFSGTIDFGGDRQQGFDWTAAALGTFNPRAGRFNAFSGSFAGRMDPSYSFVRGDFCSPSLVWECDELGGAPDIVMDTVAFGNWAVRYNAAASKAYSNGRTPNTPAWAR